jgi:hypothetical protein
MASTGGNTSFDNPNNGTFEEGTEINITAVAEENYFFTEWSNGSRENPLILTIDSNLSISPKFVNKQDLIKRFQEIVIGNGENGPMFTLRWKEMKIFLDGFWTIEFENELSIFLEELNSLLENDIDFLSTQVSELSSSNVHIFFTTPETYKDFYKQDEDLLLEDYLGYAKWKYNGNGYIYQGRVFVNGPEMNSNRRIKWTIKHELGHILGLKHTEDETIVMHPSYIVGKNDGYSDIDKEALRFLHDKRMPLFSDSDSSIKILENILEISSSNKSYSETYKNEFLKNSKKLNTNAVLSICGQLKN